MIVLNWDGSDLTKDQAVYFYVIGEIYKNHSGKKHPLKDKDVIHYMESEYGFQNVDPHIIGRYRGLLRTFGFVFCNGNGEKDEEERGEGAPRGRSRPRKGYFLESVFCGFDDATLINAAMLAKCNKSFDTEGKKEFLLNLGELVAGEGARKLIQYIDSIDIIDEKGDNRPNFSANIAFIMKAIENHAAIIFAYEDGLGEETFKRARSLYPLSVFIKNDDYYLLGINYYAAEEGMITSQTMIYKLKNIKKVARIRNKERDTRQKEEGTITSYKVRRGRQEVMTVGIKELLNGLGEIKEGLVFSRDFQMPKAEFETEFLAEYRLRRLVTGLKDKFGSNLSYTVKNEAIEDSKRKPGHRLPRKKATIRLRASQEEIIQTAIQHFNFMTLVSPEGLGFRIRLRLKRLLNTYPLDF